LFSQVHNNLLYLRNILLSRCISVKRYFQLFSLDNISFASNIPAWDWSRSNKKATYVAAASMSGCLDSARKASHGFVPNVNRLTGTNLAKTSEKRHNKKSLAEGWGVEPTVRKHCWEFIRPPAYPCVTLPLNGAGGGSASQTFAPHSHFKNLILQCDLPRWISYHSSN
jgi:hypothetical protein